MGDWSLAVCPGRPLQKSRAQSDDSLGRFENVKRAVVAPALARLRPIETRLGGEVDEAFCDSGANGCPSPRNSPAPVMLTCLCVIHYNEKGELPSCYQASLLRDL